MGFRQMEADLRLVVLKRGGQSGQVAINLDKVTYVSSSPGAFTDVHFGEHRIAVEGSFQQVIARFSERPEPAPEPADERPAAAANWLAR
jgi:hypothetical protein